ncbi:MAG: alpha/beta hydrolase [Myxococcales bacterium]|nr:alpha/beta hydrolase [Myxococcales bacterium]MCB9576990.1 alpha/beta hydrolase [Polyangiaceae bacterium]
MVERLRLRADGHALEAIWIGPPPEAAPTLVLLHEGLGSVSTWRDWPQELAAACECGVLVFSRWGYGRSEPAPYPRSLRYMHEEALRALPDVLAAAGVERGILLGHSDGGSIALIHAGSERRAACVQALVLLAPHVFVEDISVRSIAEAKVAYETGDLRLRLARHHADVDGAFYGWNRAWLDPEFRKWNIEEYLPRIELPVLAIQGDQDPYGTLAQIDAIERGVRGPFSRVVLPGAGHAPQRDARADVTRAIAAFVRAAC